MHPLISRQLEHKFLLIFLDFLEKIPHCLMSLIGGEYFVQEEPDIQLNTEGPCVIGLSIDVSFLKLFRLLSYLHLLG